MASIRSLSASLTTEKWRSFSLRFLLFFVRMWFLKACFLFNFPEAVLLKRFAAPELDFIFGMTEILFAKILERQR